MTGPTSNGCRPARGVDGHAKSWRRWLRDGMRDAWDVVVVEAERDAITMREAAVRIGVRRVVEAQRLRGIA